MKRSAEELKEEPELVVKLIAFKAIDRIIYGRVNIFALKANATVPAIEFGHLKENMLDIIEKFEATIIHLRA